MNNNILLDNNNFGILFEPALQIIKTLKAKGFEAYFVGGCVRDALINLPCKDIDIVTNALPGQIENIFPRTISIGKSFGVINVIIGQLCFDVATFRIEQNYLDGRHPENIEFAGIEEDAKRRDFTINAIFYDPQKGQIIDFYHGVDDLKNKILRTVGSAEERFKEDYLRMLRAVRFAARFDLKVDLEIIEQCKKMANNILKISSERIYSELTSILTNKNPHLAFQMLFDWGILELILPEIAALHGCAQPERYHPEGDAWNHTMLLLKNMSHPSVELAWSALLHDVGKPLTLTWQNGVPKTLGHAKKGATEAIKILQRLHASRFTIDAVANFVYNHMTFIEVKNMKQSTFMKFVNQNLFEEQLELHRLDCISGPKNLENYNYCLEKIKELKEQHVEHLPQAWVLGKDLLLLKLKPGKHFKSILNEVYDLQLDGHLHNREEALSYISQKYVLSSQNKD